MSHVSTIACDITDLEALKAAAKECGMELVQQSTYRWFGKSVGDYPIPEGFTEADLGHCEYAIRIPGNPNAYEVGVVRRRDGRPGYTLIWDFWAGGHGLESVIEKNGGRLKREYALAVGMRQMARKGFRTERVINPTTNKARMRAWRA